MITATKQLIATLPPEWHETFLERAAVIEFDAKQPREDAESAALTQIQSAMLAARIKLIQKHQGENAKPVPLIVPSREPILDRKTIAAGGME